MIIIKQVRIRFSKTEDKKPLAVILDPLCGNDSAHTPQQLRDIALLLNKVAEDIETVKVGRRNKEDLYFYGSGMGGAGVELPRRAGAAPDARR